MGNNAYSPQAFARATMPHAAIPPQLYPFKELIMRRFTPLHLQAVKLEMDGLTQVEIGHLLNRSAAWVSTTLSSPEAEEIRRRIMNRVLDSAVQVQVDLQAIAPIALQKKVLLLNSSNDAVANRAATDLLELAGHVPTRQVEIRRPDLVEEEFKDKSEQDIRNQILAALTNEDEEEKSQTNTPQLLH